MKIGELAKRTGLAPSTIRFYEEIGVLTGVQRSGNGYRNYPAQAQWQLALIIQGQQAGFSLDELRQLIPANLADWQHGSLLAALQQKIADITALEQKLAANKQQLQAVLKEIEAKPDGMACAENARRVLTELGMPTNQAASAPERTHRQTRAKSS